MLKKLVLFETKENVANFSTCLGHGNEPSQRESLTFLGEHALSPLRIDVTFDNIEPKASISKLSYVEVMISTSKL
jgi:hypothetical protein